MGGIGPMQVPRHGSDKCQGQANVFFRYAPEKIPFAIDRYQKECRRLFEVLNGQLEGKDYIVGEISIADFATFPWVRTHSWSGVSLEGLDNIRVRQMDSK